MAFAPVAMAQSQDSLPLTVGYASADAVKADVLSRPGVVVSEEGGWIIATIPGRPMRWYFTTDAQANNAAVRREVVRRRDGALVSDMSVICQGDKVVCDQLYRTWLNQNDQLVTQKRQP